MDRAVVRSGSAGNHRLSSVIAQECPISLPPLHRSISHWRSVSFLPRTSSGTHIASWTVPHSVRRVCLHLQKTMSHRRPCLNQDPCRPTPIASDPAWRSAPSSFSSAVPGDSGGRPSRFALRCRASRDGGRSIHSWRGCTFEKCSVAATGRFRQGSQIHAAPGRKGLDLACGARGSGVGNRPSAERR
jgi:hypothetical protein